MVAGRYTVQREIGRGGMGAVWLGLDEVLGRQVALKRVGHVPGGSTPDLERAEREARLAARLNHPHVVAVYDLVIEDDERWLVMEYVEGPTLAGLVRREGALAPDRAAPLICQAADALAAAHAAGIVHRDVKPSNILVTPDNEVKLSDFGIARAEADATLTQTGLVTGSPAYLAPEVATGQAATDASDVWSLGATLFHALAGHPPYEVGDNVLGALYRIVHEEPPRLENAGWLGPLLQATMTRDPGDRWSMARVRDFLASGPSTLVAAPPPPAEPSVARTQVLSAPVAPPPAAPPPPTSGAPSPHGRGRGRRSLGPLAAAAALVAAAVVVGLVVLVGGDGEQGTANDAPRTTGAAGSPGKSRRDASSPSPSPSSDPPSTPPRDTTTGPTADGMASFISSYLATVTSDPAAAWDHLSRDFQRESGGFGQYKKFWESIESARVTSIDADPEDLKVEYTVDYVAEDGRQVSDKVKLELVYADGGYLIADED